MSKLRDRSAPQELPEGSLPLRSLPCRKCPVPVGRFPALPDDIDHRTCAGATFHLDGRGIRTTTLAGHGDLAPNHPHYVPDTPALHEGRDDRNLLGRHYLSSQTVSSRNPFVRVFCLRVISDGFAIAQRSCVCPEQPGFRRAGPNCLDEFGQGLLILHLTVLPAMHAVVEMDDIELFIGQNQIDLSQQHGVGRETGGGETCNESFPGKTLFDFSIVIARNGVADEQDAREIGFVRVGNPDVAPLDGFTGGRQEVWISNSEAAGKRGGDKDRQWQVLHKNWELSRDYWSSKA